MLRTSSLRDAHRPLVTGIREGRRDALARAISVVENEREGFQELLHAVLEPGLPAGRRVGVTGPPGAGKSSLVAALAQRLREAGEEVGIIAVDPTSPFSGGALLGDRIRMGELATDPGIFIRSMASRGSVGGLATTTKEVLDLMDASGFGRVLVETVGVGQTELEITGAADTVVVVLVPESGDAVQAMKAGLMEIGDLFVVNKADRPGADRLVKEIRSVLELRSGRGPGRTTAHHGVALADAARKGEGAGSAREEAGGTGTETGAWIPPVLRTVAHAGEGVDELLREVDRHRTHLNESGELVRRLRRRTLGRVRDVVEREIRRRVRRLLATDALCEEAVDRILRDRATPYSVAAAFLARLGLDPGEAPLPGEDGGVR